jgi:hypothetical protein
MSFDNNIKNFFQGIRLVPVSSSAITLAGQMEYLSSSNKFNVNNGTISSPLVGEAFQATLTNKLLVANNVLFVDGTDNTKEVEFNLSGISTGTTVTWTFPNDSDTFAGLNTPQTFTNVKVLDSGFGIINSSDNTKQLLFSLGGSTTGTSTTLVTTQTSNIFLTLPSITDTIVGENSTQTLTNKTITEPIISEIYNGGILTLPTGPDTLVSRNSTDTLTNKTLTNPIIADIYNAGLLVLPTGPDTLVARTSTDTLTNKTLTAPVISTIFNGGTLTLPTGPDTIVGEAAVQTLTNKTFGDAITFTEIATPSDPPSGFNKLYFKGDNNLYSLTSGGVETQFTTGAIAETPRNFLINSDFIFCQRALFNSGENIPNNTYQYVLDRWYSRNTLGNSGVITVSQITGTVPGSLFALKQIISTAPISSQLNECELYQVLENKDSIQLYGQTASFSIWVKALGNVNTIGIQFFSAAGEAKLTTPIGSEVVTSVNSSTFTHCFINGQALGTSWGTAGVVGVRIRIVGVSSGNQYDLGNGFVCEQAMLNLGGTSAPFRRAGNTIAEEQLICQRYYEKSYAITTPPGSNTTSSGIGAGCALTPNQGNASTLYTGATITFAAQKRTTSGTFTNWDLSGFVNATTFVTGGGLTLTNNETTLQAVYLSDRSFNGVVAVTSGNFAAYHWAVDDDIL